MRVLPVCVLAVLAGGLAAAPAVAATSSATSTPATSTPTAGASQKMAIVDLKFANPRVKLSVGDTMTWTNDDRAPHDVSTTKAPVKLQSPLLTKGQSWRHTFEVAGVYDYICTIHPEMKAAVDVAAASKPAATKTATRAAAAKAEAATAQAAAAAKSKAAKNEAATKAKQKAAAKATQPSPKAAEPASAAADATQAPAAEPSAAELAVAAAAERAELFALTANARELEDLRQYGAALVGVLLAGLLIVGMQGRTKRLHAPVPDWAAGVGVSPSRHARGPKRG
ncbi:MAG: plastocyanin/azurin family copper-binding protein [Sporichthyaceae bacterium]